MMKYITIKRFKRRGIGGQFNIPYGTPLELSNDGMFYFKDLPVCVAKSAAAHNHFARDDDGDGRERGKLSHAIIKALEPNKFDSPQERDEAWKVIWNDKFAQKYRRKDHVDTWLWSDDFFNATITDLEHIFTLVKGGEDS